MGFKSTDRTHRRLTSLSTQIAELRSRLAVVSEQVDFLVQVEADAKAQAVVGDAAARREHRAAERDLAQARRERQEVASQLTRRRAEQDRLLEGLLD